MTDLSKLPMIVLSMESVDLMDDILEDEGIANVWRAIRRCVRTGEVPDNLSRAEMGVFNMIMNTIERKGQAYLNKVEAGKNNFAKVNQERKDKKEAAVVEDTPKQQTEITEQDIENLKSDIKAKEKECSTTKAGNFDGYIGDKCPQIRRETKTGNTSIQGVHNTANEVIKKYSKEKASQSNCIGFINEMYQAYNRAKAICKSQNLNNKDKYALYEIMDKILATAISLKVPMTEEEIKLSNMTTKEREDYYRQRAMERIRKKKQQEAA